MSKQLLVLGNGFDLHCGLKSSYKDFFRYTILDTIGERFNLAQMKAGVSGFWEGLLMEYYKTFGNIDYSWCDIESIIKETLYFIYCGNNKELVDVNNGLWLKALNSTVYRRNPPEELNSINRVGHKDATTTKDIYLHVVLIFYIICSLDNIQILTN